MKVSGSEPQVRGTFTSARRKAVKAVKPSGPGYTSEGIRTAESMRQSEQNWADEQITTTSCLFCKWKHKGTAVECRDKARTHREKKHPEACVIKPRLRRRLRKRSLRSAEEEAQIAVDTTEARRLRSEREQNEMLAKIERGRERDRAAALALDGAV